MLYAGAILTAKGLRVLEYNVRFGDPEAQALLPRLESDLLRLLFRAARAGGLGQTEEESEDALLFRWSPQTAVTVTLASARLPRVLLPGRSDRRIGSRTRGGGGDPRRERLSPATSS